MSERHGISTVTSSSKLMAGAGDKWREVVSNLENLHKYARPDEVETARLALHGIIGEITVVEEKHRIAAYPKLGNNAVYYSGSGGRI